MYKRLKIIILGQTLNYGSGLQKATWSESMWKPAPFS